jgi:hypothetical protein
VLVRVVAGTEPDGAVSLPTGTEWQDLVFETARASPPYLDIQGPGYGGLFGRYGASGMPAEIDTAVDHDGGILSLVESKAREDYTLCRDEALVFSGKVRDHEESRCFRWQGVQPLIVSAGRLDAVFCRWCFYEGIDVIDPDRFPLIVLARLPYLLGRTVFSLLQDHCPYDWLRDVLQITANESATGPMLLRNPARRGKLREDVLHDLNDIQARLSECVWSALLNVVDEGTSQDRQAALLDRARREFEELGVVVPSPVTKPLVLPPLGLVSQLKNTML